MKLALIGVAALALGLFGAGAYTEHTARSQDEALGAVFYYVPAVVLLAGAALAAVVSFFVS
jgi:hypothetical protein